jgi:thioesterase domain-containing protein
VELPFKSLDYIVPTHSASPLFRLVCRSVDVITSLNENGNGSAFYCIHSIGGEVSEFRHLAHLLGPEQRFYGIQVPAKNLNAEFASSVEGMAQYYVDALCAFQPAGPFLLGGWSAGSIIALEVAQQLKARGREVPLLIVIDGAPWNTGGGISAWHPMYYWKLARNLPRWIADDLIESQSLAAFLRRVRNKLKVLHTRAILALRGERARHGDAVPGFLDTTGMPEAHITFMKALFNALYEYTPQEYAGPVLVYAARTQPLYHLSQVEAVWAKIAAQIEVIPISGTHTSIVREPHVIALADHLRQRLAEFRLRAGSIPEISRPRQFDHECLSQEERFQRALEPG